MQKYKKLEHGGFAVKRKARIPHDCIICGGTIEVNEDYYQVNKEYERGWKAVAICNSCWHGKPLDSRNKATYT